MSTLERLRELLQRDFEIAPALLHEGARLEDLDIDSLRMIEILFCVEDAFKIAMPSDQAEVRARVKTLGDLAGFIDELAAQQHAAKAAP